MQLSCYRWFEAALYGPTPGLLRMRIALSWRSVERCVGYTYSATTVTCLKALMRAARPGRRYATCSATHGAGFCLCNARTMGPGRRFENPRTGRESLEGDANRLVSRRARTGIFAIYHAIPSRSRSFAANKHAKRYCLAAMTADPVAARLVGVLTGVVSPDSAGQPPMLHLKDPGQGVREVGERLQSDGQLRRAIRLLADLQLQYPRYHLFLLRLWAGRLYHLPPPSSMWLVALQARNKPCPIKGPW